MELLKHRMQDFKQELQTLLVKYPDVESISFKVTETVTRNQVSDKVALYDEYMDKVVNKKSDEPKKEKKPLSPLEKVISPEMMAKIKANSSIE